MNRRNFFKSLSAAVVGIYVACQVKLPKLETAEELLRHHQFESNLFSYYPSFYDFIQDHIKDTPPIWHRLLKNRKWKPNMGSVMRQVNSHIEF